LTIIGAKVVKTSVAMLGVIVVTAPNDGTNVVSVNTFVAGVIEVFNVGLKLVRASAVTLGTTVTFSVGANTAVLSVSGAGTDVCGKTELNVLTVRFRTLGVTVDAKDRV
jgi:hypothetical protein